MVRPTMKQAETPKDKHVINDKGHKKRPNDPHTYAPGTIIRRPSEQQSIASRIEGSDKK